MNRIIRYHDEYAAWEGGDCECPACQPRTVRPQPEDNDDRDDTLEWGGVDY